MNKRNLWIAGLALMAAFGFSQPVHAHPAAAPVTIDLCATAGAAALPGGGSAAIWGYAPGDCSAQTPAASPGPILVVNAGDEVTVVLHNNLPEATSLSFPAQQLPSDRTGAAPGGAAVYTFVAGEPGTYLYEAGLTNNGPHQVGMGMVGVLIVRPAAAGQVYDDPATAYDDEAVVVLGELDPALNGAPATFDMRAYAPKYWLINGKAFPNTDAIATDAGRRLLVRYVNAGQQHHSMTALGLTQTLIGSNGKRLAYPTHLAAHTLAPGQTAEVLINVPAAAVAGTRFPLYDATLLLHNNGAPGFGGMLTHIVTQGSPGPTDTTGPAASAVSVAPNTTLGGLDITATIDDSASGNANIAAADYYIDTPGNLPGTLAAVDGAFDEPVEAVQANLPAAAVAALSSGSHTVYVRGQDANGNWGSYNLGALGIDNVGPTTGGLAVTPNPTAGGVDVALTGTANDSAGGNSSIAAVEYLIDQLNVPTPMSVSAAAPVVGLSATIPAATVASLTEGVHTISVRSKDAAGNWGAAAQVQLSIDRTGPVAANITAAPNPNNGNLPINSSQQSVRIDVQVTEVGSGPVASKVKAVEAFFDAPGPNGSGIQMLAVDGLYDSPTEAAYVFVPLTTIRAMADGAHQIHVHGQDSNNTWGAFAVGSLVIDKAAPAVSAGAFTPNPTNGAANVTLTATAADGATNIAAAEWFRGADPGVGRATALAAADGSFNSTSEALTASISLAGLTPGQYTFSLRARDAAGNWSAVANVTLTVSLAGGIFSDGFESGTFAAWTSTSGSGLSITPAAAMAGSTRGMQVAINGAAPSFVVDGTPANEAAYDARFYFHPNASTTGGGQHDIFVGVNSSGTALFSVQYRRLTTGGGTHQLRIVVARPGGTTTGAWQTITNAPHYVEVLWVASAAGGIGLYTDGALRQAISNLNLSAGTYRLDAVRLGPSAGLTAGNSGAQYYDSFVSKRTTSPLIGP